MPHAQSPSRIDLTTNANQPFTDPHTGACIVFNGEIYNYREIRAELISLGEVFNTTSDTEVLLKAFMHWREKNVLSRLNGMFAFAIYEPECRQADSGQRSLWR